MAKTKSELTRERIMKAGAKVFSQKGYALATLEEIAHDAETFAGSLYYHFSSKEDLVERVFLEGIYRNTRHIVTYVEANGANASPLERLRLAIFAHVCYLLEGDIYSSAALRVYDDLPDTVRTRILAAYVPFDRYWRDLIEDMMASTQCKPSLNPSVARHFLLEMLNHSMKWFRSGKLPAKLIAEQACEIFLHGFADGGGGQADSPGGG